MKQNKKEKKGLNKKPNKRPLLRYEHNFMWLSVFSLDCNAAPGKRNLYNDLNRKDSPKRDTFIRLEGYERVGISRVDVYGRVPLIQIFLNRRTVWPYHFNL